MIAARIATAPPPARQLPVSGIGGASPDDTGRWRTLALAGICLLATVLYAWRIGSEGWGNPYYAAAVKSMSQSLTNFVFGSFDPVGVVTVDKPPMAFWPMVAAAAVFGYHGWSLLLPQVIEGVAAVVLLYAAVRRWAGRDVALLAALILALTPVTVAINRDTNPDTLMVLLLVAAAYAFTRSVEHGVRSGTATRWLLLAAAFLGLGFVTKMLQAWIVVPVFALAYLVGAAAPVRRRVLDLLGAGAVLLAGSMWWVLLVSVWPGPRPYIGGSADGSVLNLVIGYNGLGRVFGQAFGRQVAGGGPGGFGGGPGGFGGGAPGAGRFGGGPGGFGGGRPGGRGFGGFGGRSGLTRMFGDQVGGQISWLLPLALLVLVGVGGVALWRMRAGRAPAGSPQGSALRAGWVLWGGWLVLVGLVLSFAQGTFHAYYTTEMAPAVAAVTAAGLALLWRRYRSPGGYQWMLLPAAVVLTVGWAWVLVSRDLSWNGWLRYAVAGVGLLAVVLLVANRPSGGVRAGATVRITGVAALVALLLAPAVWSGATAFATGSGAGAMAQAGPPAFGRGRIGGFPGFGAAGARNDLVTRMRGLMRGDLTTEQRRILDYARAGSGGARITLAVEGGAMAAETYLINSDAPVVGMGGFSGQDPAPDVATLAGWVQRGELRYVLVGDRGGRFGPAQPRPTGDAAGTASRGAAARAGARSGVAGQRVQWVQQHCTAVDPAAYGGTRPAAGAAPLPGLLGGAQVLYDCRRGV